jgi:hypothetical protein
LGGETFIAQSSGKTHGNVELSGMNFGNTELNTLPSGTQWDSPERNHGRESFPWRMAIMHVWHHALSPLRREA